MIENECGALFRALLYFDSQRFDTGDFVVMPNLVHLLLTPYPEFELEDVLHSVKRYTVNHINRKLNRFGTLWMEESCDHIVRNAEELLRIQTYIRDNPAKANLEVSACRTHQIEYKLSQ